VADPVDAVGSCRCRDRSDEAGDPCVVPVRDHLQGLRHGRGSVLAGAGDRPRLILDSVVQQPGDQHVGVGDAVVTQHPQGHPEQVVEVRLAGTALPGVQFSRPGAGVGDSAAVILGDAVEVQGESAAQAGLSVEFGDGVQWHHPQLSVGHLQDVHVMCCHAQIIVVSDLRGNYVPTGYL
jgi:hypothetical protein